MSLSTSLTIAQSGLSVLEKKISVTSNNLTNASTDGYTKQTYTATYTTTDLGSVATGGSVQNSVDAFLLQSMISQTSDYQKANVISTYLSNYDTALGSTSSSGSTSSTSANVSSDLSNLLSAISSLSTDASSDSSKSTVVSDAEVLAAQLNSLSSTVQTARQQASSDIATSVSTINSTLDDLASLNKQISGAASTTDTASLIDQRNSDLTTLASQLGIQYYYDSNNSVHVYTTSGEELLGSTANHVSYTDSSNIGSTTTYPGGISGITVGGKDITTEISSGKLGGLIQLRDATLPAEQSKLDALADTLTTTVNTITNQGASIPPRASMTGSTNVSSSDALSATGTVRIAVTDSSGTVQSYADLDLSSYATVGDLVTALNGISGVSASISASASGGLTISSTNASNGISINEMTSSVGSSDEGFSMYFGLNNVFDGSNGASDIKVSSYLQGSASYLATGSLSDSSSLVVGSQGVTSGDASIITALNSALTGNLSFPAAGGVAAQSTTLTSYTNSIISSAALSASNASDASDSSSSLLDTLQSSISSQSGVNINEETANATILQNAYEATAQLMSIVKDMFSTLMQAIS